jgi:hypothetical protein
MKMQMFATWDKAKPVKYRKYKRLQLGFGQAYDRLSDHAAVKI